MNRKRMHYMGATTKGNTFPPAVCDQGGSWPEVTPDVRYVTCQHCKTWLKDAEPVQILGAAEAPQTV